MALDKLFILTALLGGILFLVQLIMLLLGGHAGGADAAVGADFDGGAGHPSSDVGFKLLSVQGITAFVMMFGLVGWAMRVDSKAGPLSSLGAALAAGAVSMWFIARLFRFFHRLQSTGTLDLKRALGATGEVYLAVGPGKPGKVTLTVGTRHLTLDAVTEGSELLATGTAVRVTRVISDSSVCVERT